MRRPGLQGNPDKHMIVCGKSIKVQGRLIRIASLDADAYQFLDDPQSVLEGFRKCGTRIDLFTFMQRLPETSRKYAYLMEWDNLAALAITTFHTCWTQHTGPKPRNMPKKTNNKC